MTHHEQKPTDVLYNAACPVCRREIDHYAQVCNKDGLPVTFTDLNDPNGLQRWGLDADTAARRLYVRKAGKLYSGVPAFVQIWQEIPRYQWLAKVVNQPVVHRLAVWIYDLVLAPLIYRWHKRRINRRHRA